jgi:hypothetical protein
MLPRVVFKRAGTTNLSGGVAASGTSMGGGGSAAVPWPAIAAGAVVVVGVLGFLILHHGGSAKAEAGPTSSASTPVVTVPQVGPSTVEQPEQAATPPAQTEVEAAPRGPSAREVGQDLKSALDRQRLWSDVSVGGDYLEVRSSSCSDPAMGPMLDAAMPSARAAGLRQVRCVSRSGEVVSTRAL